jgi:type II secretory pathway pseudopilin PulG
VTNSSPVKALAFEGYSLAELMIVVTCSAILLAAAVPNVVQLQREWTLWGSARVLEAALQWGRMHAISSNSSLLFVVDVNQRKFFWADPESGDPYDGSVRYLSSGVHIISCPNSPLRFYQHGNAAPAGTYTLEGEAGSYSVVVSPGGRIRIQRN